MNARSSIQSLPEEIITRILRCCDSVEVVSRAILAGLIKDTERLIQKWRILQRHKLSIKNRVDVEWITQNRQLCRHFTRIEIVSAAPLRDGFHMAKCFEKVEEFVVLDEDAEDLIVYPFIHIHAQSLKRIDLRNCRRLTRRTFDLLLTSGKNLGHLDLQQTMITKSLVGEFGRSMPKLRYLNLSRCFLLDNWPKIIPDLPKSLEILVLDGNFGVDIDVLKSVVLSKKFEMNSVDYTIREKWALPSIKRIYVKEVDDNITQREIEEIGKQRPKVEIEHTAKLWDHSRESVREYLQALIQYSSL